MKTDIEKLVREGRQINGEGRKWKVTIVLFKNNFLERMLATIIKAQHTNEGLNH